MNIQNYIWIMTAVCQQDLNNVNFFTAEPRRRREKCMYDSSLRTIATTRLSGEKFNS